MDDYLKKHGFDEYQIVMIKYKYGFYGNFFTKLIELIMAGDPVNQSRLSQAFSTEVYAVQFYQSTPRWWPETEEKFDKIQAEEKAARIMKKAGLDPNKKGDMNR